jgi:tetratricopeptide (TPR) repeat protein
MTVRIALILMSVYLSLGGCGLPRIIVLSDPLTPEEHLNLGVTYEKNNELDAALKEYRSAAEHLPVGYLYMGNVYFAKAKLDSAEKYYRKAIAADPGTADARNNLAWLYYTRKIKLDEAETLVREAIRLDPTKADLYRDTLDKILSEKR